MLYDEYATPGPYLPLRGTRPTPQGIEPSPAERTEVLRVVEAHPRWRQWADRVHTQLRLEGHDIPLEVVEVVLADLEHPTT